jgi:hypothetical protein
MELYHDNCCLPLAQLRFSSALFGFFSSPGFVVFFSVCSSAPREGELGGWPRLMRRI